MIALVAPFYCIYSSDFGSAVAVAICLTWALTNNLNLVKINSYQLKGCIMSDDQAKSVLSFYEIPGKFFLNLNFKAIWEDFVDAPNSARCTNVFHFDMTTDELLNMLRNKDFHSELLKDISAEASSGANVVFVQPIKGAPLDGFFVHELLED
jgi:hypothetical protein